MSSSFILNTADRERLTAAHPAIFNRGFMQRFGLLTGIVAVLVYLTACFFFFNVGPAFMQGRWDRASSYIQDWYSWRAQPRLRFEDGKVNPQWSSRMQYPADAPIDWLQPLPDGGYSVVYAGTQDGNKVLVHYGFAGQAEIRTSQVYVQRRFLGWANFLFDTKSEFWGKSYGDLAALALWGERLDPTRSNISHMVDDFLDNGVWQHADILSKLMQTLVMAFVGTLFGTLVALPLAFLAARNITANRAANWGMKRLFDFLRSIDMLIWALFFTRSFGPGPIPGIAAIFFTDTGALGKVYAEALENVDDKQREGVKSVGASPIAVNRFGVLPQVLPVFISQSLYFWESNTRSATIIGAVGAGGIGLKLLEAMGTNADWDKVAYMVLLILFVVFLFDHISNSLRSRLIGKTQH